MDPSLQIVFDEIRRRFDQIEARWEQHLTGTRAVQEQREPTADPHVGNLERSIATPFDAPVTADNWGGLFNEVPAFFDELMLAPVPSSAPAPTLPPPMSPRVLLGRIPRVTQIEGADVSVALAAPPLVSQLTIFSRVFEDTVPRDTAAPRLFPSGALKSSNAYEEVKACWSAACSRDVRELHADGAAEGDVISLNEGQEVADEFHGAAAWWTSVPPGKQSSSNHCIRLTFDKLPGVGDVERIEWKLLNVSRNIVDYMPTKCLMYCRSGFTPTLATAMSSSTPTWVSAKADNSFERRLSASTSMITLGMLDQMLKRQHRPWPPPTELRLMSCDMDVVQPGLFSSSDWLEKQPWPPPHVQVEFKCDSAAIRPSPWPSFLLRNHCAMGSGLRWKPPWPLQPRQDIRISLVDGKLHNVEAIFRYLGGAFDVESLVDNLLSKLTGNQDIVVNAYAIATASEAMVFHGHSSLDEQVLLLHVSMLDFGDPLTWNEMRCRYRQKLHMPWSFITNPLGTFVTWMLLEDIICTAYSRSDKVSADCRKMKELKTQALAADVAKSQFPATVSHEIETPINVLVSKIVMVPRKTLSEQLECGLCRSIKCHLLLINLRLVQKNHQLPRLGALINIQLLGLLMLGHVLVNSSLTYVEHAKDAFTEQIVFLSGMCRGYDFQNKSSSSIWDPGGLRFLLSVSMARCVPTQEQVHQKCGGNCQCVWLEVPGQKFRVARSHTKCKVFSWELTMLDVGLTTKKEVWYNTRCFSVPNSEHEFPDFPWDPGGYIPSAWGQAEFQGEGNVRISYGWAIVWLWALSPVRQDLVEEYKSEGRKGRGERSITILP